MLPLTLLLIFGLVSLLQATPAHTASATPNRPMGSWSSWSRWGSCSRSCDGGVSSRTRSCLDESGESNVDPTVCGGGNFRQDRLCSMQACPSVGGKAAGVSYRDEQCAKFDRVRYEVRVNG